MNLLSIITCSLQKLFLSQLMSQLALLNYYKQNVTFYLINCYEAERKNKILRAIAALG